MKVENNHHGMRCDVESLCKTVHDTWENNDLTLQLTNIFNRLAKVLSLIIEGKGGNDLVEISRGKKATVRNIRTDAVLRTIIEECKQSIANQNEHNVEIEEDVDDEDMDAYAV